MFGYVLNNNVATTELDKEELDKIKDKIMAAYRNLRANIGYRSKIVMTHPDNLELIRSFIEVQTRPRSPDVFIPFPIRVMADSILPKTKQVKIGVRWHDTQFCSYSSGPAVGSQLTPEAYESMCLYFGWATPIYQEQPLFYELHDDYKNVLNNLQELPMTFKNHVQDTFQRAFNKFAKEYEDKVWRSLILTSTT